MAKKIPQINASSMADISFLLLIFFLVTTSMDVNQGLSRRLPPPKKDEVKTKDTEIHKRDLLIVKINSANQLMVNGEKMDVKQLKDKVKEFITNPSNDPNMPERVWTTDLGPGFEPMWCTPKHVISVQNDVDTQYQAYLEVQSEIVAAYNELRDACAKKYFGKKYDDIDEKYQDVIKKKIYPQNISEAEPKNYN